MNNAISGGKIVAIAVPFRAFFQALQEFDLYSGVFYNFAVPLQGPIVLLPANAFDLPENHHHPWRKKTNR